MEASYHIHYRGSKKTTGKLFGGGRLQTAKRMVKNKNAMRSYIYIQSSQQGSIDIQKAIAVERKSNNIADSTAMLAFWGKEGKKVGEMGGKGLAFEFAHRKIASHVDELYERFLCPAEGTRARSIVHGCRVVNSELTPRAS
jgi:hypothetical protein